MLLVTPGGKVWFETRPKESLPGLPTARWEGTRSRRIALGEAVASTVKERFGSVATFSWAAAFGERLSREGQQRWLTVGVVALVSDEYAPTGTGWWVEPAGVFDGSVEVTPGVEDRLAMALGAQCMHVVNREGRLNWSCGRIDALIVGCACTPALRSWEDRGIH